MKQQEPNKHQYYQQDIPRDKESKPKANSESESGSSERESEEEGMNAASLDHLANRWIDGKRKCIHVGP